VFSVKEHEEHKNYKTYNPKYKHRKTVREEYRKYTHEIKKSSE